jgi:hypothetical protein
MAMSDRVMLHQRIPFNNSPDVLIKKCQEIIQKAGYSEEPTDIAFGFGANPGLLDFIGDTDRAQNRSMDIDSKAILFWYRQSPLPFETHGASESNSLAVDNPPLIHPGEIRIILDTEGHLVSFQTVPTPDLSSPKTVAEPDWEVLFSEAGLDISQWNRVDPKLMPPFFAETRAAWEGRLLNLPSIPVSIEASALQRKPISFEIIGPWEKTSPAMQRSSLAQVKYFIPIFFIALAGGVFFAKRNLRLGRGDRRNAIRLAIFTLLFHLICRAFGWHYSQTVLDPILSDISTSFFMAGFVWIFYTAMEPFVRRQWPKVLVSWTRLLSGDWQNPLIARDVLIGCAFGILMLVSNNLWKYIVLPV